MLASMDPIPMETEAPAAHDGTTTTAVVAGATTNSNPKKRSLYEVVPPAFVALEEDGGAYGVAEMPKRFVLGNKHPDKYCGMMATFYAMDARVTAVCQSARRSAAPLIHKLRAQDAARDAAALAANPRAGDS